ncbi:Nuclear transcription factor Y subunit C-2 [Galdieria sulphuraria]|uniref:Nuclear transcription factor Y, gamma n=1 Tax=Galdieria sulphuraria TaxID=130081 RepID=M2XUB9_GALSU|nr:nuclear transcription factor Y, gamma [Galdieria sulphuraria]EME27248.1 nuclear transcription factor Y, gamma [Galdieria sulphuraria]GJD07526.1 Nuclear transcription factor Y subunit C-2 [Galdieria sulphuraria]|eukprot:XP_005703768.1 nuclear transcription factor Y, gamma [Galdieria sulphuraria]
MYNEYLDAGQNEDDKNTWRATSQVTPEQQQEAAQFRQQQLQQQRSLQALNATLAQFWDEQMREVSVITDFKNHMLPLARIKKIMKSDEDVRMISAEAPALFSKACEMFILELTIRAWAQTEESKRRTLQRCDIASAIQKTDIFDFLIDIVPREDPKMPQEHGGLSITSSTDNPALLSYRGYGDNPENLEPSHSHLYAPEGYGEYETEVGQQGINYAQLSPQQLQILRMRQMQMREPFSGFFEGQGPQY